MMIVLEDFYTANFGGCKIDIVDTFGGLKKHPILEGVKSTLLVTVDSSWLLGIDSYWGWLLIAIPTD